MNGSFLRRPDDRTVLLRHYRGSPGPAVRLRCHILLLLDAGHPWALIAAVLFTSSATINRWRRAYPPARRKGLGAMATRPSGRNRTKVEREHDLHRLAQWLAVPGRGSVRQVAKEALIRLRQLSLAG